MLKLDPEESQRPKPSANAKPLPEHLKENDASLDISNRTDGVPEMGDPFQDPNAEQKWAEFNTAPAVVQKVAKVDVNNKDRFWHYLGKNSTEARAQFTHDLSVTVHNPKSNFLDTVKPPPPIYPQYQQYQQYQRPYPVAYPLQPAPGFASPRTPTQPQRPYSYKPKDTIMTSFRAPAYNPDTRKNPNSPVAHQPNVTYDHRSAGSPYGQPTHPPNYQTQRSPQGGYIPYAPPPHSYSTNAKSPTTNGPPHVTGFHHYIQAGPPPNGAQPDPNVLPPFPFSQSQGPVPRPVYGSTTGPHVSQSQPHHGNVPVSNSSSTPTGTSRPSMYANSHSSLPTQTPSSQAEYLAYVTKYPYLKNAFLRRAKTYVSPYSPNGGFTNEWAPKVPSGATGPASMMPPTRPGMQNTPGVPMTYGGPPPIPMSRPTPQFQSPDAFRHDLNKAPRPVSGAPKWETMVKNLNNSTSAGPAAPGNTLSPSPLPTLAPAPNSRPASGGPPALAPAPVARPPSTAQPPPKSTSPSAIDPALQSQAPVPPTAKLASPAPILTPPGDTIKPETPQRPEVSPISDHGDAKADGAVAPPPVHAGETWRYAQ